MSGEFRPEQNSTIEATDDPELARAHGLTQYDKATGQWRAPSTPDAGQRDGADVHEAEHRAAREDGDRQHEAEHGEKPKRLGGEGDDVTEHDERVPGAPNLAGEHGAKKAAPAKATGSKAKADDSK